MSIGDLPQDPLKQAAIVIRRLKERLEPLERLEQARTEPIAIVGMGCRFPGGASSPEAFWALLDEGRDAIQPLDERWQLVGAHPNEEAPRWAGLLSGDVDRFDAAFFGISPREAKSLDPQHRLLLEIAWEALEDAGVPPDSLHGSDTGVFLGVSSADYADAVVRRQPPHDHDAYGFTGNLPSVAAGRLAYTWGLQGPCMTVDTACSSSLVAVHLACQSLRARESDLALAGGVNLLFSPQLMDAGTRIQAFSPDGRCKTFDASANGFARGEGCGLVVLKRLSDAKRDGDKIWALIRGSAVNQDGRSTGLTAPNVLAQEAILRKALRNAGVEAKDIGFIETHGTGTSLGDPIEVAALAAVLGGARPEGSTCVLGAVKTNLGHLEAAAGIAGLIKAVLALHHERIPRNLNLRRLSPHIQLEGTPFVLPAASLPWRRGDRRRLAGVSSFGLSGTNAHLVVEEAPESEAVAASPPASADLLVLSAKSEAALDAQAARLRDHLEAHPELRLGDVAFSLATKRSPLEHRLAVAATSRDELREILEAAARGETPPGATRGRAIAGSRLKVVFVFPGQGSQWLTMGRRLLAEEPAFRAAIEACDRAIVAEAGWSLLAELTADEATSQLARGSAEGGARIDVVQPVLFAMAVALSALWRSWGVEPDVVMGHSMGEVAAAHVAGALSLEDAVAVICRRSRLLLRLSGQGEMALVELPVPEAQAALRGYEDRLSVAVSNSPRSTVLSGDPAALGEVLAALEAREVFCRRVKVDVASHSPQVDPLLGELRAALSKMQPGAVKIAMRSTVTGAAIEGPELAAGYWADNLRQPVRFAEVAQALLGEGYELFVEVSPHPLLVPAVAEMRQAAGQKGAAVGSLRREQPERQALLESLGTLWAQGAAVGWERLFPAGGRRVSLPAYPWQRERFWPETERARPRAAAEDLPVVAQYYDAVVTTGTYAKEQEDKGASETYLTLGPFPDIVPGFSWMLAMTRPELHKEHAKLVLDSQKELRAALFRHVDFASCTRALDFGCGLASDLITLAKKHPHLALDGYTLSPQQASTGAKRARHAGLTDRVRVFNRDSAKEAFPGMYDLVFGFEVAHHIRDKGSLFKNVGDHMKDGGLLVLADFVSNVLFEIEHEETSSFFLTRDQWIETLADNRLRLLDCVDVSQEIANFLHDPAFEATLESLPDFHDDANIRAAFKSYDGLGRLLRRGLSYYVLLTARKEEGLERAELARLNRQALEAMVPYAALGQGGLRGGQEDWFIELDWEAAAVPAPKVRAGRFLLLGEGAGLGAALRAAIEAHGHTVVQAVAETPTAVVHLGSLEGDGALDAAGIEGALVRGPDSVLLTVQSLAGLDGREPPRLWLLTRGAQPAGGGDISVSQAPLLGLGRVVAMEHPELRCARVDLDPARPSGEAQALLDELLGDGEEQEIALRGGVRRVARLVRKLPEAQRPERAEPALSRVTIRSSGSYLVTGGLGGLGLSVAGWLAERGAGHLVLVGRSGAANAGQQAAVAALEAKGTRVIVARADVSDRAEMARALEAIAASGMPLAGIVHAAGLLDDGVLLEQTPTRLREVMAPKAHGALHLHELTRGQPLDFFVMYASGAGLLGSPGQGNYAAANTFLDALAHHRRALGLTALSIDWGAFSEVGLAAAQDNRGARLASRGVRSMAPEEGLTALERLLQSDRVQVAVLPIDMRKWAEFYPAATASPMLARLRTAEPAVAEPAAAGASLLDRLARAEAGARKALVLDFLRGAVSRVMRIPEGKLDVSAPLIRLGLDSLMGVELKHRLKRDTGVDVPMTRLLRDLSVALLAQLLLEHLPAPAAAAAERRETQVWVDTEL